MLVIVDRIPNRVIEPGLVVDFGRRESYHGNICYRGQSGETTVMIITQADYPAEIESAAARILADHPVELVICVGTATPLVPYLQRGDLVVADRILAWPDDGEIRPDNIVLDESEAACISSEPEIAGGVMAAYEMLCGGKSDRPQLIVGSVVSGNHPVFDKHAAAKLHQRYGVIVGDKGCLAIARTARAQDIRFLYLGMVFDPVSGHDSGLPSPASAGQLTAVLRRFIRTRPIATVAPVAAT
jgi:nucleoside phosphorylase